MEKKIRKRIRLENISNVYFMETSEPEKYLGMGDVFVHPSLKEGFPNALMEAMSAELASVGFEIGGVGDLITHAKTGFLAPRGNVESFSQHLFELIQNPEETKAIGKAARNEMKRRFPFEGITKKYFGLYQKLVKK